MAKGAEGNEELQGSAFVCHCIPRNWVRLLKRASQFLRILFSYPLYLVFWDNGALKPGAPHVQILLLNLLLYYLPCIAIMMLVSMLVFICQQYPRVYRAFLFLSVSK